MTKIKLKQEAHFDIDCPCGCGGKAEYKIEKVKFNIEKTREE